MKLEIITAEAYKKIFTDNGCPEVCAVYDQDTINILNAQAKKTAEQILAELYDISCLSNPRMISEKICELQ